MGERQKMKVQAHVEFARAQREKIEISSRLRELEKWDRTTSERIGDLDSDTPNENVYHLVILPRREAASVANWTNRT